MLILLMMTILVIGCDTGKSNSDVPDTPDTSDVIDEPGAPINITLKDESHYFILSDPNDTTSKFFSKSGEFYINDIGKLSDINGYIPDKGLGFNPISSYPILMPNLEAGPRATQTISVSLNLPSDGIEKSTAGIDSEFNAALSHIPVSTVTPSISNYNHSNSIFVIDSIGDVHTLNIYYVFNNFTEVSWEVRATLDGYPITYPSSGKMGSGFELDFDGNGVLDESWTSGVIALGMFNLIDADVLTIAIDFRQSISKPLPFEVYSVVQDGSLSVQVTELIIDEEGFVSVKYNDLQTRSLGRIALAKFESADGLIQVTDSVWVIDPDMPDLTPEIIFPEAGDFDITSPLVIDLEAVLNN